MKELSSEWRRVIAGNMKRLRLEFGLSLEELSLLSGIDQTHLARFESHGINVSLNVLIALAFALNVNLAILCELPAPGSE